ncbi:unnamed protein product [Parajaminaea phylloscopi]
MPSRRKEESVKITSWLADSQTQPQQNPYDVEADEMAPAQSTEEPSGQLAGHPAQDWEQYSSEVARTLLTSSTKAREETLSQITLLASDGEHGGGVDLTSDQRLDLTRLILQASPRYAQRSSRILALHAFRSILEKDEESLPSDSPPGTSQCVKFSLASLKNEADHACKFGPAGSLSSSISLRAFVLTHVSMIFAAAVKDTDPQLLSRSPIWNPLVQTFGIALDAIVGDDNRRCQNTIRNCLVLVRRTMRECHAVIPTVIETITSSSASSAVRLAPLLGLVCDVSLRLRAGSETTKGSVEGLGRGYVRNKRGDILSFYTTHILSSKTAVSPQAALALRDFVAMEVSEEEVIKDLLPVMEKLLVRSPEISLVVEDAFFQCYAGDCSAQLKSLLPGIVSASKSSVAATRNKAATLFATLVARCRDATILNGTAVEILTLLKTAGKTSSPDQRSVLYTMLKSYPDLDSDAASSQAEAIAALLPKETTEPSLKAAMSALGQRLTAWLQVEGEASPAGVSKVGQAIGKEMQNPKVPLRKVACATVGDIIWQWDRSKANTKLLCALADALAPALDANLKTASTSTLTSTAGPLEGYVAVALLEGPFNEITSQAEKVRELKRTNQVIAGLLSVTPKPSFLLHDRVHRKFSSEEESCWLLRALQAVWMQGSKQLLDDAACRTANAHALLQNALLTEQSTTRRQAVEAVKSTVSTQPVLISQLVREAVLAWAAQHHGAATTAALPKAAETSEQHAGPRHAAQDIKSLMSACVSFDADVSAEKKYTVLTNLVICSHLPQLGDSKRTLFAMLCKQARVDTRHVIESSLGQLLQTCRDGLSDQALRPACLSAITSLTAHAPESTVAELVGDIEASIDAVTLEGISDQDLGVWATPPDQTFVDVLADGKAQNANLDKNRKDAKIEQWEAELRADIAKRKAAETKSLTKEQKAKIDAQLKIEADVRRRINDVQTALRRSMQIVTALVAAGTEELDSYLPSLVTMVRGLLQIPQARHLDQDGLLVAFTALCSCASSRLAEARLFIKIVLLRTISDELVADDFTSEPLLDQVLRVLYRLRFLSEQEPLSLASLAVVVPLLSLVVTKGGIDAQSVASVAAEEDKKERVADAILEQIQLALDVINFHAGSCEDVRYPRAEMIDDLVIIVARHSPLARDAVGALRSMGEAMKDSALPNEIAVLLRHTLAQETYVRLGALQALQSLDLTDLEFSSELWLASHDPYDAENARLASKAWEENGLDVPADFAPRLLPYLEDDRAYVRRAAGRSLAGAVSQHPGSMGGVLSDLYSLYQQRNKILMPEHDQFGMIIESTRNRQDPWHIRVAIADVFADLAEQLEPSDLEGFFEFMIGNEALGDRNDDVRQRMLDAASSVIDLHGKDRLTELISRFETFVAQPPPPSDALDGVLEAVVILLGRIARHLSPTDKRVASIVERLLEALRTPSEMVQVAVADCLPALVPAIKNDVPRHVERLFHDLFLGAKYAHRRGSAYGLAGIIKGRGISAIAEFEVMPKLALAIEDKANASTRQSAVECYGILASILQRLFEPYIIEGGVIPHLIASFGDSKAEVRDATEETAKVIMQNVSAYCAKLMMPTLLEGLEEKQWRTKKGAIELLGAYSSAAPAQLAAALPTVIPRLSSVLSDAHPQVRSAGNRSLKQFGMVMRNPEIKTIVPTLLQALVDPTSKTAAALHKLLAQTFAHYLDAPSLALVVPIVDRGLRDRSAQIQRDGAKITGNLASLTDGKDLKGHLPRLMPLIREVLVSPVPETRAEAARALGVLVERLGEVQFPDLVPSLMSQLRGANVTGVDRQGAAQGLSEVLAALGMDRLEALLPSVLDNTSNTQAHVREGGIALLIYLPGTFGPVRFAPYVSRIVTPILNGLADTSDSVREMSMRAGRMIIGSFAKDAVDLLLPELEQGMFDDTPRIRLSSLQLCSELLFRLGGISGKNTFEGEDAEGGEGIAEESITISNSVQARLRKVLGEERFVRTISTIFCLRQDPAFNVRDAASNCWKAIIVNTAKTVRELLTMIIDLIIRALSREGEDQREIASRTLGELTRKLGGSVLDEIVPQLQQRGSDAGASAGVRAGVMLAVESLLENATDAQLEDHQDALIESVRRGLTDRSSVVREAAASAFDALQGSVGQTAVEQVIPTLLGALQNREEGGDTSLADTSLAALREVMRTRADAVFPASLPTLLVQPITAFNARALADLVGVAGNAINRRISTIVNALSIALESEKDEETHEALEESIESVLTAVTSFDALHQLMMFLLSWVGDVERNLRKITHGCRFYTTFVTNLSERGGARALEDYNADWLRRLASLLDAREPEVLDAALPALAACVEAMEDPEELVIPLRHTLSGLSEDVSGLARKEGFGSCSGVFLAGLMSGTGEQREQAALGLGLLVKKADPVAIKPFVTTGLAGPLIRACGERHAAAVKAAILNTLEVCLVRIPQHLKPFYPQLSRSFLKAVVDPTGLAVRAQAARCLGTLSTISGARLDLNALLSGARCGIRGEEATVDYPDGSAAGLAQVLLRSEQGSPQIDAVKADIVRLIDDSFASSDEERFKTAIADVFAGLARHDADAASDLVRRRVLPADTDATLASLSLASLVEHAPEIAYDFGVATKMAQIVSEFIYAGPAIARPAREARELMKTRNPWASDEAVVAFFEGQKS